MSTQNNSSAFVQHLLRFCSSNDSTEACIIEIEKCVGQLAGIAPCAVFLFNRENQTFERVPPRQSKTFPDTINSEISDVNDRIFVQKCRRNATVIGLICLDRSAANVSKSDLQSISSIVSFVYNRLFAANLFGNIHVPINYHQPEDQFFIEIELLTRVTAGMCAGALREINQDRKSLNTICAWNLGYEKNTASDWDIANIDHVPIIKEVIDTRKPKALNSIDPMEDPFFQRPEQRKVRSAVFSPVLVGSDVFGVLSFAQHIPYEYSDLEINGFFSIANAVGVSIHNFRQASLQNEEVGMGVRNATVFTALEVAQAARHTAKGVIDTVNLHLAKILLYAQNNGLAEVRKGISNVSENIITVTKALDDIKAATKPPKNELVPYSLLEIWEEAQNQLLGKLNNHRISCRWTGPDVTIHCYPDQVRQLFLNLIINSVDAYVDRAITGKRNISIRSEIVPNTNLIKLTYVDNAGGLDIPALRAWKKDDSVDFSQLIFEKDVTTKGDQGSGWGLFICRRVMARHQGSIDVLDHRRGMTLLIQFPKEVSQESND
jgi:signal transduction histidine kinase